MCMCMHNRYMNMHIGHYPMLELRCICTIYTCIKSNNDYPGRIQHQYHPKRFRCRVCYDASERPAFVDFSWTFANPLPVTPKVYKVLKITFSLKITWTHPLLQLQLWIPRYQGQRGGGFIPACCSPAHSCPAAINNSIAA